MANEDNNPPNGDNNSCRNEDTRIDESTPSSPSLIPATRPRRRVRGREEISRTRLLRKEMNGSELWEGTYKGPLSTQMLQVFVSLSSWNIFHEKNHHHPQLEQLHEDRVGKLLRSLRDVDHTGLVQYLKVIEDEDYIDILIQHPQVREYSLPPLPFPLLSS